MTGPRRAALVTGGAAGIGKAVAARLAATGMRVVVVDRQDAVAPPGGVAVPADLARSDECARAVREAVAACGRLDVLVNSAGIQRYGDVVDTCDEVWDEVIAVNLSAAFRVSRAAMPHLREAGGTVVNVASVQAFAAQRGVAAYAASKGGLVALTRAMAVDEAPRVRVNAVCPGSVDTPMLRSAAERFAPQDPDGAVAAWGAMHPMGRVSSPEEVAAAVAFLAGPDASFVTGAALLVDGGLLSQIGGT